MTDYDHYLYDDFPFAETHPDRLAAIGALFGLRPAHPTSCRVLEIGAGLGGNLLPLAAALPESSFLGIDLAVRPLAIAAEHAAAAGLSNVELRAVDVRRFDAPPRSFDFIICHGVYSWVPADAREAILRVIGDKLAPHGVAYLSFNALPGWHLRGALRDMLRREVGDHGSPAERVARAREFLRFLKAAPDRGASAAWLKGELAVLEQLSDSYLFYEHLVPHNHPQYFSDFVSDAARFGLTYVADTHVPSMMPERLGADAARAIEARGRDQLVVEQSIDFMDLRLFRRAVLCRSEAPLDRHVSASRLTELVVSSTMTPVSVSPDLRDGAPEAFSRLGGGEITTDLPLLKAALVALADHAPGGLSFGNLSDEARKRLDGGEASEEDRGKLSRNLLGLYTQGVIELGTWQRPIVRAPSPRPEAFRWARFQAASGRLACTNLLHQSLAVDTFDRALLRRMDGTRSADELVDGAVSDAASGELSVMLNGEPCLDRAIFVEIVERKLENLARAGFVVA